MSTDLILFTLNSGQEVIAEIKNDASQPGGSFRVSQPLVIVVKQIGPNQYGLDLVPFSPSNPEGDIFVYQSAVVAQAVSVPEELAAAYRSRTSKIEIVSSLAGLK